MRDYRNSKLRYCGAFSSKKKMRFVEIFDYYFEILRVKC